MGGARQARLFPPLLPGARRGYHYCPLSPAGWHSRSSLPTPASVSPSEFARKPYCPGLVSRKGVLGHLELTVTERW